MEARKVNISNGWLWIKQGYWLFKKSPILLVVLGAICIVGTIGIASIAVVGDPLATILFPTLFAGFMLGCRALEHGDELELAHLFSGLKNNPAQLISLGGINLVSQLLILGVMSLTGGEELVDIIMAGHQPQDPAVFTQAIQSAGISLLLGMTLFSTLLMAMQFAPMLVVFHNMPPLRALLVSFKACLRNIVPLTLYASMLIPFAILASVPIMLGWLVLVPVLITSMYAAYRDLFPEKLDAVVEIPDDVSQDSPPSL